MTVIICRSYAAAFTTLSANTSSLLSLCVYVGLWRAGVLDLEAAQAEHGAAQVRVWFGSCAVIETSKAMKISTKKSPPGERGCPTLSWSTLEIQYRCAHAMY